MKKIIKLFACALFLAAPKQSLGNPFARMAAGKVAALGAWTLVGGIQARTENDYRIKRNKYYSELKKTVEDAKAAEKFHESQREIFYDDYYRVKSASLKQKLSKYRLQEFKDYHWNLETGTVQLDYHKRPWDYIPLLKTDIKAVEKIVDESNPLLQNSKQQLEHHLTKCFQYHWIQYDNEPKLTRGLPANFFPQLSVLKTIDKYKQMRKDGERFIDFNINLQAFKNLFNQNN